MAATVELSQTRRDMMRPKAVTLCVVVSLGCCAGGVQAETIFVPAGGDIQAAINESQDGDVIQLEEGLYQPTSTIELPGGPGGRAITLRGVLGDAGEPVSVIDGQNSKTVILCLQVGSGTRFERLVITRGNNSGMQIMGSSPVLDTCIFLENTNSSYGGGLSNSAASPTLINCTFIGNTAAGCCGDGGAMANDFSNPTLTDCTFESNSAIDEGGAIFNLGGAANLTNCTFIGNTAEVGGSVVNEYGTHNFTDCTFKENVAASSAGGMYNYSNANVILAGSSMCSNTPTHIVGPWQDNGGNTFEDDCPKNPCPADLNGNGGVDGGDVTIVLGDWGLTDSPADLNGDGVVGGADLTIVLASWGVCP